MYKVSTDTENWSDPKDISELGLKALLAVDLYPDQYKQAPYYTDEDCQNPIYHKSQDEYIDNLLAEVRAGIPVMIELKTGISIVIMPENFA